MSRDTIETPNQENGSQLGIWASFQLTLGQLRDTMTGVKDTLDRVHRFMSANPIQSPIMRVLQAAANSGSSAATYTFLDLGGPTSGTVWDIRRICITAADPFTTLAGASVFAFRGMANQFPNSSTALPSFSDMLMAPGPVPNDSEWGEKEITLLFPEHVLLVVKSAGNNVQLIASGQAEEYVESRGPRLAD